MKTQMEQDLREWMDDWLSDAGTSTPIVAAEEIRNHVRRRERVLALWAAADAVMGLAFLTFLVRRAITDPDPVEKLAMGLLVAIVVAVLGFAWWNWRSGLRASAESTSAFLAIALDRSRRLRLSIRAGWVVLAAEVAVFAPWIWYHLHEEGSAPTVERAAAAWGFLAGMVGLGAIALLLVRAWAHRDARRIEGLRREIEGD